MNNTSLIDKLKIENSLSFSEWQQLLETFTKEDAAYASNVAREIAVNKFGNKVFFRGIVEFTNYCKNDCYYCGIRCSNKNAVRYRLSKEDILICCEEGYKHGYRTFVLQGGEDNHYTDDMIVDIVSEIHSRFPDCAITLSIGEKERESYERFFKAGATRYLLRHETANEEHYGKLHPKKMSLKNRINCLKNLKEIGYQTGCGCMVGTPHQKITDLCEDMMFMSEFKPEMIGIGPFISHKDTPFRDCESGSVDMTLFLLSLCRIMLPNVLLPATTALGTVRGDGRKLGVLCGANVIMPNLSPIAVRKNYLLYDNKAINGEDAGENLKALQDHMSEIGYEIVIDRGDYRG